MAGGGGTDAPENYGISNCPFELSGRNYSLPSEAAPFGRGNEDENVKN